MTREQPPHTLDEQTILVVDDDPSALKIIHACLMRIQQLTRNLHEHAAELERVNAQLLTANQEIQALNRGL